MADRFIIHSLKPKLNPKEEDQIYPTIDALNKEELISVENQAGTVAWVLTQRGFDTIYPTDPDVAKAKIKEKIVNQFRSISARVGHCIDERWIIQKLIPSLNPKEQNEIDSTLREMEREGLITIGKKSEMMTIALAQHGFDTIY